MDISFKMNQLVNDMKTLSSKKQALAMSQGLEELKNKLIDTSRRNKLINYKKPSKSKNLKIIDESSEFIYDFLVKKEGKFKFVAIPELNIDGKKIEILKKKRDNYKKQLEENKVAQGSDRLHVSRSIENLEQEISEMQRQALLTPEERAKDLGFNVSSELPDIDMNNGNVDEKHTDDSLQTLHYPNEMEKILQVIERNARSIIEETGSNMLYLVLGILKWQEAKHSEHENKSPLITIPVVLTKTKRSNRYDFTLEYSGEGIETNRSLAEKLLFEFGIILPELNEETSFRDYIEQVRDIISDKHRWSIKQEISLDFLHFGKILMYQDLKAENWDGGLINNPVLNDIFIGKEITSDMTFAPEYDIDSNKVANNLPLVMDADSSQHSAIVDIIQGKNVIIEGPPGTGKSQTISNAIAALLSEGKSILFVSEKLAALEVVHKRLKNIGLSDFCLELHSHKSKKTYILESIRKRIDNSYPDIQVLNQTIQSIESKKQELKKYIDTIHKEYGSIKQSIYTIFWSVEKYSDGARYLKLNVPSVKDYTHFKLNNMLDELAKFREFHEKYEFDTFFWQGFDLYKLDFIDIDDYLVLLDDMRICYIELDKLIKKLPFKLKNEIENVSIIASFIDELKIPELFDTALLSQIDTGEKKLNAITTAIDETILTTQTLTKKLQEYDTFKSYNDKLLVPLKILENIIKELSLELNFPKKFKINYIKSLLKAIEQLVNIEKIQYLSLTQKFATSEFDAVLIELENNLLEFKNRSKSVDEQYNLNKVDSLNPDDINRIEKVVEDNKNSFFNFFSSEYRSALKEFDTLLKDGLPKEKSEWSTILNEIKTYILNKYELNNHQTYKSYFGDLFTGIQTDIDVIKALNEWSSKLRQSTKNLELVNFILSSDAIKFEKLLLKQNELNTNFSQLEEQLRKMNMVYDQKVIQKFYYDIDEINIVDLREKLRVVNDDMNTVKSIMYKEFDIQSFDTMVDDIIRTCNNVDFQEIEYLIQKSDSEVNDFSYRFNKFFRSFKNARVLIDNFNAQKDTTLAFNMQNREVISNTIKIYNEINQSIIPVALKKSLIKNFNIKTVLDSICDTVSKLNSIEIKLQQFGVISLEFYGSAGLTFQGRIDKLNQATENKGTLSIWSDFRKISHFIIENGFETLVKHVESKQLPLEKIEDVFLYGFYNSLVKEVFREYPILVNFSRLSHEQVIRTYRELDEQLILQNRKRVAYLASQRNVPQGYRSNRKSELTELSLIENELSKKTRHIPIRQLIRRAPNALKGLKPCFMMSPLSVSQYLPPNEIAFDVLVVDEASQLRPEEALGSIARASQVVIVGDPKQLPPTSFFDSIEKAAENETVASESESILDICMNLYKPIRQLRWHYRSQHESLIDFSNQQFYDGNLLVFPSPTSVNNEQLGVKYHYIKNSVYQNRRNKIEAKILIEHLELQMKKYPDRSIGVGTFNSDQRDLIQDMVDEHEKNSPVMSNYMAEWRKSNEPFFIKNLENLQGDERDVIFISTTYGKDKDTRKVYQRFGPINSDTGWRRLNVMFTRAKQKMEVFSSLSSGDIIVSENSSRGVRSLKAFLYFLETSTITRAPEFTGRGFDSEFEESVYKILSDVGYKVVPQVGVAGYFIDLSVVSEKNPNDFVLAIECDGASYHSSKSARDRDRLKQEVLERLGWNVYRIWSVDWYKNREHEISKLIEAIRIAQAEYKGYTEENITQEIVIQPIEKIDIDIDEEIKKEEERQQHSEDILEEPSYSQVYLSKEKVKEMLIELRDTKIAKEFKIDRRCILSDLMIDVFLKYMPMNMDEFRNKIPLRYRNENVINIDQMQYLPEIFEILEFMDE